MDRECGHAGWLREPSAFRQRHRELLFQPPAIHPCRRVERARDEIDHHIRQQLILGVGLLESHARVGPAMEFLHDPCGHADR